jgi:hypothetical protein
MPNNLVFFRTVINFIVCGKNTYLFLNRFPFYFILQDDQNLIIFLIFYIFFITFK